LKTGTKPVLLTLSHLSRHVLGRPDVISIAVHSHLVYSVLVSLVITRQ